MKAFILVTTLFSFSLIACPDLSGDYQCTEEGESYKMTITQTGHNFSITDDEGTSELIADENVYPFVEENFNGGYIAGCDNQNLAFEIAGDLTDEEGTVSLQVQGLFEKTASGMKMTVQTTVDLEPKEVFTSLTSCQKL